MQAELADSGMDEKTAELAARIDAACRRMTACIESRNLGTIKEVEKLTFELAAERRKISDLEASLEESERKSKALESVSHELSELRAARSRDLEELSAVMAELKPLVGDVDRA